MKNLTEIIKKLSQKQLNELAKSLEIKGASKPGAATILNTFLTFGGIARIISRLSSIERKILQAAYNAKNGITYEDIGKLFEFSNEGIDEASNNLSSRHLVYILKNRQKLSNKLDKIHLYPEVQDVLNPLKDGCIRDYFIFIKNSLEKEDLTKYLTLFKTVKKDPNANIPDLLFNSGGLLFYNDINTALVKKNCQKILTDLIRKKYIFIYNDLDDTGNTVVMLDRKVFIAFVAGTSGDPAGKADIHNRYNMLLNLLRAYDAISTYGLFLTKQNIFRKIDRKRLESSMAGIIECDGRNLHKNTLVQLVLYFLNTLNTMNIRNDAVAISLKGIKPFLSKPFDWLVKIIKYSDEPDKRNTLLNPPFEIPEFHLLLYIIELLEKLKRCPVTLFENLYYADSLSGVSDDLLNTFKDSRNRTYENFRSYIRYLCIMGIVDFEGNDIMLSDIGLQIAGHMVKKDSDEDEEKRKNADNIKTGMPSGKAGKKIIYLNPDFTMMIPKREIPSDALYHLLTHTEIINDDIILNTIINRESILKSLKRGMENDKFFNTLNQYLKNEIPGNLKFLINEWLNQTIKVNIFNATILKTDPSFIDKIAHSKVRGSIIKRISQEYVIIDRRYIDKVVKFSKENDAVINLFDESGQ